MNKRHISTHKIICWRYTKKCNRKCIFCLSNSDPTAKHPKHDYKRIINRMIDIGVKKISYSGGEPLLHPQLLDTIQEANRHNLEQVITTNGDYVRSNTKALDYLQYIKLSFYGHKKAHDSVMGTGHYNKLLGLSNDLSTYGHVVGANLMLSRRSIDCVENCLRDFLRSNIRQVLLSTYIPKGIEKIDNEYQIHWSEDFFEKLIRQIAPVSKHFSGGIKIHNYNKKDFFVILDEDNRLALARSHGESNYLMGSIYDDIIELPEGNRGKTKSVLNVIWNRRLLTDAIRPIT